MAATKIVNVLKGDSFEELLDIFRTTSSQEVIFILPKRAKAFSDEDHFVELTAVAGSVQKTASFMTADPAIADIARRNGFDVLSGGRASSPTSKKQPGGQTPDYGTDPAESPVATVAISPAKKHVAVPVAAQSLIRPDDEEQFEYGTYANEDDGVVETSDEEESDHPNDPGHRDDDDDLDQYGMHEEEDRNEGEESLDMEADRDDFDHDENALADEEFSGDEDAKTDEDEGDADPISAPVGTEEIAATLARSGRSLEGFAKMPLRAERIRIPKPSGRSAQVGVRNERSRVDDIEQVWMNESGSDPKESLWKTLRASRPSWWSRMFSGKKTADAQRMPVRQTHNPFRRPSVPGSPTRKWIIIGSIAVIVAGVCLFLFIPGSAKVVITPVSTPLNAQFRVSISNDFTAVDSTFNKIPGQLFEITATVSKEFSATGEKQVVQKARGTIAVSNAFSSAPQPLVATTRFQSAEGLIFRTLRTITVPGTTVKNGEIVPGKITVEVIADKTGAEYNIGPTTFTIPAFKERGDTERYEKFSASSSAAITGGVVGLAKVVTESDFSKAKQDVLGDLESRLRSDLNRESSGLRIVASASFSTDTLESSAQADQAAERFTVSARGTLRTMGFRNEDLEKLMTEYIKKNYEFNVLPDRLKITLRNPLFNESRNALEASVSIEGPGWVPIDTAEIAGQLQGKSEPDIRAYLQKLPGIASAKVVLSPFWVHTVPADPKRISIGLDYPLAP